MKTVIFFFGLVCLSLAQQPIGPEDDGSYNPELHEVPYDKETENENYQDPPSQGLQYQQQPQQYQQQYQQPQQYQQQYQQPQYQQPQYQQPQYQQSQSYVPRVQPQVYQPQQPQYQYQPQAVPQQLVTDPKKAIIINEQRYLNGDGKFGSAYTQDDGVTFKEDASPDGSRRGSYSYVDPSGQRRTVTYTAGKDGFQATGDHLPVAPAAQAPAYEPQQAYQQPQSYPQQYNQGQALRSQPQSNSLGQYSLGAKY